MSPSPPTDRQGSATPRAGPDPGGAGQPPAGRMKIVILCTGQSARLLGEILRRLPQYECVGYLDGDAGKHGQIYYDIPVLGGFDLLPRLREQGVDGGIPVLGDMGLRLGVFELLRRNGLKCITAIEPSVAMASDVKIGEGSLISFGSVILNNVKIDPFAFIGSGVTILHDVSIGSNCVVGGGRELCIRGGSRDPLGRCADRQQCAARRRCRRPARCTGQRPCHRKPRARDPLSASG